MDKHGVFWERGLVFDEQDGDLLLSTLLYV